MDGRDDEFSVSLQDGGYVLDLGSRGQRQRCASAADVHRFVLRVISESSDEISAEQLRALSRRVLQATEPASEKEGVADNLEATALVRRCLAKTQTQLRDASRRLRETRARALRIASRATSKP